MNDRFLVLVRHGESTWNRENRFSGWRDVPLSDRGVDQARAAGQQLKQDDFQFDIAFTSRLSRAIKTLWIMLEELGQMWIPEVKDYRLNERHYGRLQGLNKAEMAAEYGEERVRLWRRGWDVKPPQIDSDNDPEFPGYQRRYRDVNPKDLPRGESLQETVNRVIPCWQKLIRPQLKKPRATVLVVAHGNSLRALIKVIEDVPDSEIATWELPTGQPYIVRLNASLKRVESRFSGDPAKIQREIEEIRAQGRAKQVQ